MFAVNFDFSVLPGFTTLKSPEQATLGPVSTVWDCAGWVS